MNLELTVGDRAAAPDRRRMRPSLDASLTDAGRLSHSQVLELWSTLRMYPVSAATSVDAHAAILYANWLARSNRTFDPQDLPWVPVGAVGPVLVLGHVDAALTQAPLPWGTFQGVLLSLDDYERQLSSVNYLIQGAMRPENLWDLDLTGGIGRFPEHVVLPTDRHNALRFVREYYLHSPENRVCFLNALSDGNLADNELPAGYTAAIWFLLNEGALVPLSQTRLSDSEQRRLPEALRKRIAVVAASEKHIWCTAPSLPQAEAEDRIYAELGEGWTVHWLLGCTPEGNASSLASSSGPSGGSVAPYKIVLTGSAQHAASKADVFEAEERVVVLGEKEWGRFDPRFRDAGEPESLWKWAVFKAVADGATDLHLEPGVSMTRVRQRVDGLLEEILEVPPAIGEAMVYSLMTQVGLGSDKYRPVDGSFQVEITGRAGQRGHAVRVRANAYPVRGTTQKIALRFLPRQGAVPALDTLVPQRPGKYLERALSRPEGLILVCGPTGSGKTTTIFSALAALNRPEVNVTTLENPVEIVLEGVNQAEINPRRDVTWASLNRAFLRQDPDVGVIGEIRDEDTAETILRAALTGHLVFGSLHTRSCPTSVIRMTDLGAEPNMLAESLLLVVCQRLVRRVCSRCRSEHVPTPQERDLYELHGLAVPPVLYSPGHHSSECQHCRGRGYRGRAAAVEVLPNVPAVRRLIEEKAVSQAYVQWMQRHGLQTVFENALDLAASGVTSLEEALMLQDAWEGGEWAHLFDT
jgi:type II secretory ATPase GspE/PulE/Tfp pilus assembly ATPase PilB-like protein